MLSSRFLLNEKNLVFAPTAHKKLVRFLKSIFLQPDKELVVEATGGDREQPGTAARVAHLELCHPAHVGFEVCIDHNIVVMGMLMMIMIMRMIIIWN